MVYYVADTNCGLDDYYNKASISVRSEKSPADAAERLVSLVSWCRGQFKFFTVQAYDAPEDGTNDIHCVKAKSCDWNELVEFANGKPLI